jgi:hypothetical protein
MITIVSQTTSQIFKNLIVISVMIAIFISVFFIYVLCSSPFCDFTAHEIRLLPAAKTKVECKNMFNIEQ